MDDIPKDENELKSYFDGDEFKKISDYERKRLANLLKNHLRLKAIGLNPKIPDFMLPKKKNGVPVKKGLNPKVPDFVLPKKKNKVSVKKDHHPMKKHFRNRRQKSYLEADDDKIRLNDEAKNRVSLLMAATQNNLYQLTKTMEFFNSHPPSDEEEKPNTEPRRVHPKRNVPRICYTEEEISSEDDLIYCKDCEREYDRCCPYHSPFLQVMDRKVPPCPNPKLAWNACPDFLSVSNSGIKGAGLGIWTEIDLPKGLLFGPYKGTVVKSRKDARQSGYAWEILRRGRPLYYIESADPSASNWLRFVNCAPIEERQNLLAFQYAGHIFYKTYKRISAYTELLVWYGDDIGMDLGIGLSDGRLTSEKGEPSGHVHQMNAVGKLSDRGPTVRRRFKSDILAKGRIDQGNLEGREDVDERDQEYSGERVEDDDDTTGTKSVGFKESFVRRRQPLGRRHRENCEKRDRLVHDDVCSDMCVDKLRQIEKGRTRTSRNKRNTECNDDKISFMRPGCSYKANRQSNIRMHMDAVHPVKKPHNCPHCDHRANWKSDLKRHINATHLGLKPYKCPRCDYSAAHRANLKRHINGFHDGIKPYKCPHCDYRSVQNVALKTHVNALHDGIKPYRCGRCDYRTSYCNQLKRHVDSVHLVRKPHKCPHCDHRVTRASTLKNHINALHYGIKPHKCEYCDYRTTWKFNIKRHINASHYGLKKLYRCPRCDYGADRKSRLENHINARHAGN